MKLTAVQLRRVRLPLTTAFRTSFGSYHARDALLVRVGTSEAEGWGECVAFADPSYSSEYLRGCVEVLRRFLVPRVAALPVVGAESVARALAAVRGHRMAKAALEMAVLDAELRARNVPLHEALGGIRDRVPSGVSVGISESIGQLLDAVGKFLAAGYVRVKLKIEPGWDIAPVRAVRERFGDDVLLQVDANTAYRRTDVDTLRQLDAFDLLLVEQPLGADDLAGHAILAEQLRTPICLDESITSVGVAEAAIRMGACQIVNIKSGRVGGLFEARRLHDLCAARDIPVWCGGMLESGLGRAANVALASLPGFTLPGDISASDRFYATDLTEPFILDDGHVRVPSGPGLGVAPLPEVLDELTVWSEDLMP